MYAYQTDFNELRDSIQKRMIENPHEKRHETHRQAVRAHELTCCRINNVHDHCVSLINSSSFRDRPTRCPGTFARESSRCHPDGCVRTHSDGVCYNGVVRGT